MSKMKFDLLRLSLVYRGIIVCCLMSAAFAAVPCYGQQPTRAEKLQRDRQRVEAAGKWIYNDLPAAFAEAKRTNKPIMVVLRCVPCEECVKLDDDLVDHDPIIAPLLEQFVRIRQVSTNGLDLEIFQFDTDQSFAVFFLNADGTVYGRFGTRSHRTEWSGDVSLSGLAAAMRGALELHREFPENKTLLAGKQGGKPEVSSPEQFPSLRDKYTSRLKQGSELVRSCIHCHQIGDAQREFYWQQNQPLPTQVIYQYPHPKAIGLILDPEQRATVASVLPGSPAEMSGLQSGDELATLAGQPLLSMADVQWVLHHAADQGDSISYQVKRSGENVVGELRLPAGWRQNDDISWRASSWGLRRMVTGGLVLESISQAELETAGIGDAANGALQVKFVGQYNEHAAGKNAGFEKGDIILQYDGQNHLQRESDLFHYALRNCKIGQKVDVIVWRGGGRLTLQLPIQP